MNVLFVSAEVYPFIKTGGLADVSFSLPKALKSLGVDVRIIMPKYQDIGIKYLDKISKIRDIDVQVGWRKQNFALEYLNYDGIPVYFVDNEYYFKRPGCYGYFDDGERYAFFCRAVMESAKCIEGFKPDIIHCNDWHTGLIPVLLKDIFCNDDVFKFTHSIFTIHNLKYQGVFSQSILDELLGLNMEYYTESKLKYKDGVSFMKAGIVYADKISTVSETYANEIQQAFYGEGLDILLKEYAGKLKGIVNGIDYEIYNPNKDIELTENYNCETLNKKIKNKLALQKQLNLPINDEIPIVGLISRLVRQKGFDLITCIMEDLLKLNIQLVILGTGDADYQDFFEYYSTAYPGKISTQIGFDNTLAKKIYAGADMFLMPSLFEPCGIGQLIAMRYGTIPIVRETGGLKDTVIPYNEFSGKGNGFSFTNFNAHEMLEIIKYAIVQYNNKDVWNKIVVSAMESNNNWDKSALKYIDLYKDAIG